VFAKLAIQICDSVAFRRNFIFNQEDHPELRLKSLRLIISYIALVYVFNGISYHFLVGCWIVQSWMYWCLVILFIALVFTILKYWKETVLSAIEDSKDSNLFLKRIKSSSDSRLIKELSALLGAVYFFIKGSLQWLLIIISSIDFFRPMMSSFLTLKAIKPEEKKLDGLIPLNDEEYVNIEKPMTVEEYAKDELVYLANESHTGLHLVVGEQGIGKTVFLKRLMGLIETQTPTVLYSCSRNKAKEFINDMKQLMEDRNDANKRTIIIVDDIHLLQKPIIGGVDIIDEFIKLVRKRQNHITWYCSINIEAWQFLKRVRAKKILFESITNLPKWEMDQLQALISSRVKQIGNNISFQKLIIPKHLDSPQIDGRRKKDLSYYRILNEYSDGNPTIAMYCFNMSIYKEEQSEALQVRLFNPPPLAKLESMPGLTYFILRTIAQMGKSNREDLKICAAEKIHLVDDCLNLLLFHGFIKENNQLYSISTRWFRPIIIILQRQHLLSK
jgi:hypothetical protein